MREITTPTWSTLKKAETNKVVQSMHVWLILVPVLAKSMSLFEGPLRVKISDSIYIFDISLPFTWVLFFMAALSFTAANILFIFYAPKIIKENNDLSDFERAGKDEGHLKIYFSNSMNQAWEKYSLKLSRMPYSTQIPDIKKWFWKAYTEQDSSVLLSRQACCAFYSIGFLLILIVMLENILWVAQQIRI
jgi:hypothetical protein